MKLKNDLMLRKVAGAWVAVSVGDTASFTGMLTLNETGATLWKALESGSDRRALIDALTAEYEVDELTAAADVDRFLKKLGDAGCLEEA
ncbi:MAG: PqqD family protein [Oscillospiraceae bacterium]|nr:PqqD family protein [Oscillospiraceae bacterium]